MSSIKAFKGKGGRVSGSKDLLSLEILKSHSVEDQEGRRIHLQFP